MKPLRITLSECILGLCTEITHLLGKYEGLGGAKPQPKLRRQNRVKTIQGSLAIEGNSLSLDQVTAVLDGKRVSGPKKDIQEVLNANVAYEKASELNPFAVTSLLEAHGHLMKGIIPDAGRWRSGNVGIVKGERVSHIAPKAQYVQGMVKELLAGIKSSKSTPLITSSIFHHEFEVIHPFSDGNGRMGRLWQHVLLLRLHPAFEYAPIESIVRKRQGSYYEALERADHAKDSSAFVEFMLEAILAGMQELLGPMRVEQVRPEDRLNNAGGHFGVRWFSRKEYQSFQNRLSAPTASRDLRLGVDKKLLERKGDKALAQYRFRRS
jgi:Fic family protein